ncbi:MAG: phosphoribosylglycinamide formyltransferase [Phycisphaeraceae bacterium]|nr:phosphoribosylglycinamide formyltransferase [Phycisphaerales bacterium]MCB9843255.1 phosphoribosylglycinamide formyltransferase [Phycisphaeraceae bacterium]
MSDRGRQDVATMAVFVSGTGRTLENFCERIADGTLRARIGVVVASKECPALDKARARDIPAEVHPGTLTEAALRKVLERAGAEWVVLAGYTKLMAIPEGYEGRVVNIHPALLPKFGGKGMYGMRVHEAVIAAGEKRSGCTVHLCDGKYDTGPIVAQASCHVRADDTAQTLAARVFELEKELYPRTLDAMLAGARESSRA